MCRVYSTYVLVLAGACSLMISVIGVPLDVVPPVVPAPGAHPPDPLAGEYLPLPVRGMGAAPGQVRFLALAGGGYFRDVHFAGQGTTELMGTPNLGFRGSLEASMPTGLTDAQLFAARVGPSLHLLPYRSVDLGAFLEAGAATVDLLRARRSAMFTLTPGATFDAAFGPSFAIRIEAQIQLGTVDRGGSADLVAVPLLLFGFGPVL